ncbi:MAG: KH domain-containing protein [Anaerolineales bacterium]|nr:KH domain-containing protein [Anaerolineales bacterium]MCB8968297.1 KH domain-containing protein [Ardenticatenaceae bacterium]
MKELVEFIVKSLVDYPDEVRVAAVQERDATVLELRVASADMGRVIGKSGRVINAIRDLVQVQAAKLGQNIVLDIVED